MGCYPAASAARAPQVLQALGSGGQSPGRGHSAQGGQSSSQRPCSAPPETQRGPPAQAPRLRRGPETSRWGTARSSPPWTDPSPLGSQLPGVSPTPPVSIATTASIDPENTSCPSGPPSRAECWGQEDESATPPPFLFQLDSGPGEVGLGQESSQGLWGEPGSNRPAATHPSSASASHPLGASSGRQGTPLEASSCPRGAETLVPTGRPPTRPQGPSGRGESRRLGVSSGEHQLTPFSAPGAPVSALGERGARYPHSRGG